jgi:hypothetical protein
MLRVAKICLILGVVVATAGIEPGTTLAGVVEEDCDGDCDASGSVSINELITGVGIALGRMSVDACTAMDRDDDGSVSIGELIGAVNNALFGCPAPPIVIERFDVAAGEVERVAAGVRIIARSGSLIEGTVLIGAPGPGARDRDFHLTVESGDLVVAGTITFESLDGENGAALQGVGSSKASSGGGMLIEAPNISFERDAHYGTQIGQPGVSLAPIVVPGPGGTATAQSGGDGGDIDIICETLDIEQRMPDDPLFLLGDGGDGAPLRVSRTFSSDSVESVVFRGGEGGRGGTVSVNQGCSIVFDGGQDASRPLVSFGGGGDGGEAVWDNTEFGLNDLEAQIKTVYPGLTKIELYGGRGGDGTQLGGNGGSALYASGRATQPVGEFGINNNVAGGDGGNILPSIFKIYGARGGDGGGFWASADNGWDGGESETGQLLLDAGDAAALKVFGGNGGSVPDDLITFPDGRGGDGGNPAGTAFNFKVLKNLITGEVSALGPSSVTGGRGGVGYEACDTNTPGGNGGGFECIEVVGGNGGDGPFRGGTGGYLNALTRSGPGKGGPGNPPGRCGERQPGTDDEVLQPGTGGAGATPGVDAILLNSPRDRTCEEAEQCECTEGQGAGTSGLCHAPTPTPTPPPQPCNRFHAFREISVGGMVQSFESLSGSWDGVWTISSASIRREEVSVGTSTQETIPNMQGSLFFGIECRGPALVFPDGALDTVTSTAPISGTMTTVTRACDCCIRRAGWSRSDWTCCLIAPETWRPCRVEE